jgi:hypothetical protein
MTMTAQAEMKQSIYRQAVNRSLERVKQVRAALEARQVVTLGFATKLGPDEPSGDAWIVTRLVRDPAQAETVAPESIPRLLGLLRTIEVSLLEKLNKESLKLTPAQAATQEDRLLTVEEAARLLGVTSRWLYRNAARLPYTRRLSRKALRFSELGLRRHIATRKP